MESKWKFLNIKNVQYDDLCFDEKKKIAKEEWYVEFLAYHFEAKNILCLGNDSILKVKEEVIEKVKKENTIKAKMVSHKKSNGLTAIKKHLGFNQKD